MNEELQRENERAAGMRCGCLPYAVMTAVVVALLTVPVMLMLAVAWATGGMSR